MLRYIRYYHTARVKGVNRFQKFDKYIEQHNHPHVKDHFDYHQNLRLCKHKFEFVRQYREISEARVGEVRATRFFPVDYYPITEGKVEQDDELVEPIEGKTLSGFLMEGLDKKKRKDTHRLAYIMLVLLPSALIFNLIIRWKLEPIDNDEIKSLDPLAPYNYSEIVGKDKLERRRLEIVRESQEYSAFLIEKQLSQ